MRLLTLATALSISLALAAPTDQTESAILERRQLGNQRICVPANCRECTTDQASQNFPPRVQRERALWYIRVSQAPRGQDVPYPKFSKKELRAISEAIRNEVQRKEECLAQRNCRITPGDCPPGSPGTSSDRLTPDPNNYQYNPPLIEKKVL